MLRSGDLLFFRAVDALENAIVASGAGRFRYAHTAIVKRDGAGRLWVVHAIAGTGVTRERLPRLLARMRGRAELYRAVRPFDAERVLRRAESQIGQPYNPSYDPDAPGWYCSNFVEYAFRGTGLFRLAPMHFGEEGESGRPLPFWRFYYRRLGRPIPVGKPGVSPNQLVLQGRIKQFIIHNS